ncbi:response regulator [Haloferula sp. BvORR071]|uniref:response regulator transcription factor n=1 Tax=Haloferula sp. BvORR071 TaxID=1396141 RepID=UPI0005585D08|nr:response regulator [Haloferula sp. BvORR071]
MVAPQPLAPTVFIVDDDPSVCRCLGRVARQAGFAETSFASAEEFLAARPAAWEQPACLVLDLQMPGIGGLELQRELAAGPAPCPVIFISGNGDIPATVQAMKQGAVTFLPKPFEHEDLLKAIREALEKHRGQLAAVSESRVLREQIESLTEREREVMAWVITGALNKQIAGELGVVEQTVKVHRSRVMEKMHVVSVAQLVRLCVAAGFEAAVK